jgi:hypothetical protein
MNDDNILDEKYLKEPKVNETLHLGALFLEEIKGQVEYEPDQKPLINDLNEAIAPIIT